MSKLTIVNFNTPEFWGIGGNIPGGYGRYQPDTDKWQRIAQQFLECGELVGKRVLDIGCGWGSTVRCLQRLGVNAYGLDLPFPISQGLKLWPELGTRLIVADAREWLSTQEANSWNVIISSGFLVCLNDIDLLHCITHMNRISTLQLHVVDASVDDEYYNQKSLEEWRTLPFKRGTIITDEIG